MKGCAQIAGVFVGVCVSVGKEVGVSVSTEVGEGVKVSVGSGVLLGIGVLVGVFVGTSVLLGVGVTLHGFNAEAVLRGFEGFATAEISVVAVIFRTAVTSAKHCIRITWCRCRSCSFKTVSASAKANNIDNAGTRGATSAISNKCIIINEHNFASSSAHRYSTDRICVGRLVVPPVP